MYSQMFWLELHLNILLKILGNARWFAHTNLHIVKTALQIFAPAHTQAVTGNILNEEQSHICGSYL